MAKLTIVIEDQPNDLINAMVDIDEQGHDVKKEPPTKAMLTGLAIKRLFESQTLAHMIPLICMDIMQMAAEENEVEEVEGT